MTATVAGAALVGVTLRDVFDVLFHPRGRTTLSTVLGRLAQRGFRRPASPAGPAAMLATIALWALGLIAGWALIVWPHLDEFVHFGGSTSDGNLVDAVYVSMVTLSTLGYGDVTPASDAMKLLLPLEALVGFGLLTASLSWLLTLYPALSRRRSLAYDISLLRRAEAVTGVDLFALDPAAAASQLGEITSRIVAVERDQTSYPIATYFTTGDERFSLTFAVPYVRELAERGMDPSLPAATRLRAMMLREAVDDLLATTSGR